MGWVCVSMQDPGEIPKNIIENLLVPILLTPPAVDNPKVSELGRQRSATETRPGQKMARFPLCC